MVGRLEKVSYGPTRLPVEECLMSIASQGSKVQTLVSTLIVK